MTVRMRKGFAFVEFSNAADLHHSLTLHHSELNHRIINIEKSCGGNKGSDNRKEKLRQLQQEQIGKVCTTIDNILSESNIDPQLVGIDFKKKLCSFHPNMVQNALKVVSGKEVIPEGKKLAELDRLLSNRRAAMISKSSLHTTS